MGRLGITVPGENKPPTSSREGVGCLWSSAMRKAVLRTEQREVEMPRSTGLPHCLDLHYEEDFLEKQSHLVPAIFSDLLFIPSMANAAYEVFKPPVLPKASHFAGGDKVSSASSQPEDGGPEPEKSEPSTSKTTQQVQEQVIEALETNLSKANELTPAKESPP